MVTHTDASHIDPRQLRSRALILDAALTHFLKHGFLGSNVDVVAAEAGVSKRTVYNLFESKDELFREVMSTAIDTAEQFVIDYADAPIAARGASRSLVRREITAFAIAHARAVLSPRVIAMRRMLVGEAERFPELTADYYERVPAREMRAIERRLARYAEAGLLDIADAAEASLHFAFLVIGPTLDRALFEPGLLNDPGSAKLIEGRARRGAGVFLRAYGPDHPQ